MSKTSSQCTILQNGTFCVNCKISGFLHHILEVSFVYFSISKNMDTEKGMNWAVKFCLHGKQFSVRGLTGANLWFGGFVPGTSESLKSHLTGQSEETSPAAAQLPGNGRYSALQRPALVSLVLAVWTSGPKFLGCNRFSVSRGVRDHTSLQSALLSSDAPSLHLFLGDVNNSSFFPLSEQDVLWSRVCGFNKLVVVFERWGRVMNLTTDVTIVRFFEFTWRIRRLHKKTRTRVPTECETKEENVFNASKEMRKHSSSFHISFRNQIRHVEQTTCKTRNLNTRLVLYISFFLRWHACLLWYSTRRWAQNISWCHTFMCWGNRLLWYCKVMILRKLNW